MPGSPCAAFNVAGNPVPALMLMSGMPTNDWVWLLLFVMAPPGRISRSFTVFKGALLNVYAGALLSKVTFEKSSPEVASRNETFVFVLAEKIAESDVASVAKLGATPPTQFKGLSMAGLDPGVAHVYVV